MQSAVCLALSMAAEEGHLELARAWVHSSQRLRILASALMWTLAMLSDVTRSWA